jgi:hypothetical protein
MTAASAFVLSHELGIVFAAIGLAVLGAILHVLDVKRAGRQASERAAAHIEALAPGEIEQILAGPAGDR